MEKEIKEEKREERNVKEIKRRREERREILTETRNAGKKKEIR